MTTDTFNPIRHSFEQAVDRLVREHNLAVENLTERQLVDLLKQMIKAGDIVRYVVNDPCSAQFQHKQCMVYQPYMEVEQLMAKNKTLTNALRNLVLLHDEPQPGLFSWKQACADALNAGKEALLP